MYLDIWKSYLLLLWCLCCINIFVISQETSPNLCVWGSTVKRELDHWWLLRKFPFPKTVLVLYLYAACFGYCYCTNSSLIITHYHDDERVACAHSRITQSFQSTVFISAYQAVFRILNTIQRATNIYIYIYTGLHVGVLSEFARVCRL